MKPHGYKGLWIVEFPTKPEAFFRCRVKREWNDSYALHHGTFSSLDKAKAFIDHRSRQLCLPCNPEFSGKCYEERK